MAAVTEYIDVEVPVERAYERWTHFETFPEFLDFVEEIDIVDPTHNHWRVNIGGAEREFDTQVDENVPNNRISWHSVGGETDHAGIVTFDRLSDNASRVTVQLDWKPEDLVEKAGALLGIDDHAIKKDLEIFKDIMEREYGTAGYGRSDDEGYSTEGPGYSGNADAGFRGAEGAGSRRTDATGYGRTEGMDPDISADPDTSADPDFRG
ncbi:MAG: hypothetical protein QOE16_779 [Microbacteriaceae bacterium]|jgi:uncharacterized membrane protein|nr:hypothetical protein [Microbacteriaceae bacterium]